MSGLQEAPSLVTGEASGRGVYLAWRCEWGSFRQGGADKRESRNIGMGVDVA